jgi:hypothetical protein
MDTQLAAMIRQTDDYQIGFVLSGAISNVIFAVVAAGVLRLVSMIMGIENTFKLFPWPSHVSPWANHHCCL